MTTVENPNDISFWDRIVLARYWVLTRSRPQFHYAVDVLYQGVVYGVMISLLVFFFNLFDLGYFVDYRLIGHFVGPLGAGALAAGFVRHRLSDTNIWRGWIVAAIYGGVTFMVFALLLDPDALWALVGFLAGALFFLLMHWLFELEARKARAAA